MVTMGKGCEEGIVRECGMDIYTLLYLKWISDKNILYSTGNSAQYSIIIYMGKEFEKELIHA